MNCPEAEELLRLEIAGECDPADRASLHEHLNSCPACRAAKERLQPVMEQLDRDLADLFHHEPRSQNRVLDELRRVDRRRQVRRWAAAALSAAAVLLIGVGLYVFWPSKPGSQPLAGREAKGTVTVVWSAPDAKWKATAAGQIQLSAGEIRVRTSGGANAAPVEITTPAAVATAGTSEFFIDVRPPDAQAGQEGNAEMKLKPLVYVVVLTGTVVLHNSFGSATGTHGETLVAADKEAPKKHSEDLALRFAHYYQPVKSNAQAKIPAYALPLDTAKIANYAEVAKKLGLPADEPSLKNNGFVVLRGQGTEDIVAPYDDLKKREAPIFITADTLLHLYHVQFDETLKDIEEREFYPDMLALTKTLTAQLDAMALPADTADFREAKRKALTFLAVGLKALDPQAPLPKNVQPKDVDQVLEQMKKHAGFWPDPFTAHNDWPLFRYAEDFSQYVPRGHYTRSELLKKYFVGMMWFGRMAFLVKGDASYGPLQKQPALVSVAEANQQTLAAAMLTKLLDQTQLADRRKARDVWERIYAVTSFYVGLADDLGVQEYQASLSKVCGAALDLARLSDAKNLLALKAEIAKHGAPAIYGGTGAQGVLIDPGTVGDQSGPADLVKALGKSTGFRLMGQRFVPDSYMLGKLVAPTVGAATDKGMFTYVVTDAGEFRGFPRGLDVMAVLGGKRAREIIRETGDDRYTGGQQGLSYDEALAKLQKEYAGLSDADWNRNLYWSWLYSLKPLLAEYGEGYPTFMTTKAYQTRSLNAALASWAQLRHDTILYAKQSYTMDVFGTGIPRQPKPVQGYVEPLPEFYGRLLALARMTSRGLNDMKVLDAPGKQRLDAFEKLLERLLAITEKELANQELAEADYEFIRNVGGHLASLVVRDKPRTVNTPKGPATEENLPMRTTIIADVHTDQNTKQVLEEGTGYVDLGLFVYRQPDGRLVIGAGPVLSYYEFKHPMSDRLTDEKWRDMLKAKQAPAPPEWSRDYTSAKGRY
jgi:hypothetical protein